MSIDLSKVEPLSSKSLLLEQAMRRHKQNNSLPAEFDDMIAPDFEWLKEDKSAIQELVKQMDRSIGDLASQMRQVDSMGEQARNKMEKEQQLMFKQIKTLNGLLKKQIGIFSSIEKQIEKVEIQQNQVIPQVGVGLLAGFMSAVTILVTAPWLTVLIESVR